MCVCVVCVCVRERVGPLLRVGHAMSVSCAHVLLCRVQRWLAASRVRLGEPDLSDLVVDGIPFLLAAIGMFDRTALRGFSATSQDGHRQFGSLSVQHRVK